LTKEEEEEEKEEEEAGMFSLVVLVVLEHDSPLLLPPPPLREVFPLVIFCCMDSQCGIDVTLPVLVGLHRVEF
jgi:hypothetical protein